jgi:NitT/TauT family transport system ATP-binding protein
MGRPVVPSARMSVIAMLPDAVETGNQPVAPDIHAELSGVTRVYGSGPTAVHALGPIDLGLRRGEFFSVVGPSGCGKSTLLDVLAGLGVPSAGTVRFEDKPVAGGVPDGVGVVFQEDASFPWLTVRDNIGFGLRRGGMRGAELDRRVDQAIEFMGLKDFAGAYPAQLSGGMRQRVCIARTLVLRPRLILLDEPFGALDQQTRLLMGDELLRLWRATEATVLLITHALDEAAMLADRVGVMSSRPGRFIEIVETGWSRDRTSEIAAQPAFGRVTAHLWDRLRGESIKALAGADGALG